MKSSLKTNKFNIGAERILLLFTLLSIFYSLYIIFFGKNNIFEYIQKEKIKNRLQTEISLLKEENKLLKKEISYLKKDTFFIEKKAREDLGLVKENDEVYIIVWKKPKEGEKKERWIDKVIRKYQEFILKK